MSQNKINIALLLGDPSGIGPELVSKLLNNEITNKVNIVIIGEKNILEDGNKISGSSQNLQYVDKFDQINFFWIFQKVKIIIINYLNVQRSQEKVFCQL